MNTTQPKNVFLIDDDAITNFINSKIIKGSLPFTVTPFTNAREALAELARCLAKDLNSLPDVIFLDLNMPIMDGWEFLEEYKKLPPVLLDNCIVVVLSSSVDRDDIERAKGYSCVYDFASKPLTEVKVKKPCVSQRTFSSVRRKINDRICNGRGKIIHLNDKKNGITKSTRRNPAAE